MSALCMYPQEMRNYDLFLGGFTYQVNGGMNGSEDWGGFRDTQIEVNGYYKLNRSLSVSWLVFKWVLFTVSHNVPFSLFCPLCSVILCVNVASQFQELCKSCAVCTVCGSC